VGRLYAEAVQLLSMYATLCSSTLTAKLCETTALASGAHERNTADTARHFAGLDAEAIAVVHKPADGQAPRVRGSFLLVLVVVWLLSALYAANDLRRGWLPHDEGVLAQSAERVMRGELPHRDFDELYTGGLSLLNAEAFRVFGVNLASMRYMLYLFFLAWVPCVFFIACRFVTPWVAASVTLLAVIWSVPNYSAAMPSWYNLFFASFGIAALFRYIERRQIVWLFIAGLCGGISFLFKLSGLYYVAGSALFLLSAEGNSTASQSRAHSWSRIGLAAFCVLVYEALVFSLLRKVFYPGSFLYFFLPVLAVGVAVIWQQRRVQGANFEPTSSLLKNLALFGVGVAIPVFLFLVPYFRTNAVGDFVRGVFVLPGKRLQYTIRTESLPRFLAGSASDLIVFLAFFVGSSNARRVVGAALFGIGVVVVLAVRLHPSLYDAAWVPIWNALPVIILGGILVLLQKGKRIGSEKRKQIFLLLAVTAACNLIQFPYSAPIYFCYVVPLLILSASALGTVIEEQPRLVLAALFCISSLYAVVNITPRFLYNHGESSTAHALNPSSVIPRIGSLRLHGPDLLENEELVSLVTQHARGNYIYASPDCPQVYFLSGFRNPTRTLFDFLDEPMGRTGRILAMIHAHRVNLVVINHAPSFSGPVAPDLLGALEHEFPERAMVGDFEIRWTNVKVERGKAAVD
jgi:hypothetical protein